MAFDKTPTSWIPSYSSNGTAITVPLSSFPELTAAEAATLTGDIRKIVFGVLEALTSTWNAKPVDDRPDKLTITRSTGVNELTGEVTKQYIFTVVTNVLSQEVANE